MRSRAATKDPLIMKARFKRYVVCCFALAALAATASAQTLTPQFVDPVTAASIAAAFPVSAVSEKSDPGCFLD